jgi:Arc/MetJ-type ribon-helix-helix transcriptional regulator
MMKVSFAEVDEAYLRNKVDMGYYSSVSEAIRDMVRKQREIEQNRLLGALELGEQAIREGQVFEYSKEAFDGAAQHGIDASKRGDTICNPDVRPQ